MHLHSVGHTHRPTMHFNDILGSSLMMQSVYVLCHQSNVPSLTGQSALKVSYSFVTSIRYLTQTTAHVICTLHVHKTRVVLSKNYHTCSNYPNILNIQMAKGLIFPSCFIF